MYKGGISELNLLLQGETVGLGGQQIPVFRNEEDLDEWAQHKAETSKESALNRLNDIDEANSGAEA